MLSSVSDDGLRAQLSHPNLTIQGLTDLINGYLQLVSRGKDPSKFGWPASPYAVCKLGVIALTFALHRSWTAGCDAASRYGSLCVNTVHPGYVATELTAFKGNLTAEEGAVPIVYAATLPADTKIRGQYIWMDCSLTAWKIAPFLSNSNSR